MFDRRFSSGRTCHFRMILLKIKHHLPLTYMAETPRRRRSPEEIVFYAMGPKRQLNPNVVTGCAKTIRELTLGVICDPEEGRDLASDKLPDRTPRFEHIHKMPPI